MNVGQLIEELKRYPDNLPVRGFIPTVITNQANGMHGFTIYESDACEVSDVTFRGKDICLECDGTIAS